MADATRELTFLLAAPERRLLRAIAVRIPRRFRPNHLTAWGVLGATGAGVAYALSAHNAAWLWAASAMLVLNWFGDSLDGTLARVRGAERPRYGYYLDHVVDAYSTAVIGIGIGLSPYVDLGVALGLVVLYLVLSINVYLESTVFGKFRLAYGKLGPTEVRILMVLANTALALHHRAPGSLWPNPAAVANWGLIILGLVMLGLLVARFVRNVYTLARLEPQRFEQ
jgi:phosphatidylglycerophosphate synthase